MIRNYRRYYEMALNARVGNKDTVLYSVWKYLLDHDGLTPKEIFTAIPSCSYGHLKQGVEEGALVKSGRTYSANPNFSFRGANNNRINSHNDVIDDVEEAEEVEEENPRSSSSSRGLNCHFYLDYDTEYEEELPDKIEMAGYTWSKIGDLHGDFLYLCDNIVKRMTFSEYGNNDWKDSDIRRFLNTEFYKKIPSEYKYRIVKHDGDNVFLLSKEEFKRFEINISNIHYYWWLRSPGYSIDSAAGVFYDGSVDDFGNYVRYSDGGVRPALLLR